MGVAFPEAGGSGTFTVFDEILVQLHNFTVFGRNALTFTLPPPYVATRQAQRTRAQRSACETRWISNTYALLEALLARGPIAWPWGF